jgi:putative glutathione S-transferase
LARDLGLIHVHQLYTTMQPQYTGRVTVPVLWDIPNGRIISNESTHIIKALDKFQEGPSLYPDGAEADINDCLSMMYDGLSNAVYRAGLAQRQDVYDAAVDQVFQTMGDLETRLSGRQFLVGDALSVVDLRLFATLVRFDTVYVTHFRCTRHRLTDFKNLWTHTRMIYNMPGVAETVDFDEIMRGYFLNDGDHNPHGIISQRPHIDWSLP